MKSLSILILSGTIIALFAGGVFAVGPVFAEKALTLAPKGNTVSVKSVVPPTGETAISSAETTTTDSFFATIFNIELEKDIEARLRLGAELQKTIVVPPLIERLKSEGLV